MLTPPLTLLAVAALAATSAPRSPKTTFAKRLERRTAKTIRQRPIQQPPMAMPMPPPMRAASYAGADGGMVDGEGVALRLTLPVAVKEGTAEGVATVEGLPVEMVDTLSDKGDEGEAGKVGRGENVDNGDEVDVSTAE